MAESALFINLPGEANAVRAQLETATAGPRDRPGPYVYSAGELEA
jgi:hypothetical protein